MDVIDEGKLTAAVVNPALDRLKTEIVPALQAAVDASVAKAIQGLSDAGLVPILGRFDALRKQIGQLQDSIDKLLLEGIVITIKPGGGA